MAIQIGKSISVEEAFKLALFKGKKGFGFVGANPLVGCVLLDKYQKLMSVGYHKEFGGPHAEIEALEKIKDHSRLKDGIAVVTLEPCAHHGKTPPCVDALLKLGLREVHYGVQDPNPLVAGKGLKKLQEAGVQVKEASVAIQKECELLAEIFLTRQRFKECFVAVKVASSLDGMMGLANGESQWITSEKARAKAHYLRAGYGSVLTSSRTLLKDRSRLNARIQPFENKIIPVFILDGKGESADFLKTSPLLEVRKETDVYIFTSHESVHKFKEFPSNRIFGVDDEAGDEKGKLDLRKILKIITQEGFPSVMVEAGPTLTSAFLRQGLYHRLELFYGNKIIGGSSQSLWTKGLSLSRMSEAKGLTYLRSRTLGEDFWMSGRNPDSFKPIFNQD